MEPAKVVVRFLDGKVLKGFSSDFFPNKPVFRVAPQPGAAGEEIYMKDLKAVFFVRDFTGDPSRHERKEFLDGQRTQGRKAEVIFLDGEVLVGTTMGYDPQRTGFFISPSDDASNNLRVFVISTAVGRFRFL